MARAWSKCCPLLLASGVKVVIDHLGRVKREDCPHGPAFRAQWCLPSQRDVPGSRLRALHRLGTHDATEILRSFAREIGDERLIWASDCPLRRRESHITCQQTLDSAEGGITGSGEPAAGAFHERLALRGFSLQADAADVLASVAGRFEPLCPACCCCHYRYLDRVNVDFVAIGQSRSESTAAQYG